MRLPVSRSSVRANKYCGSTGCAVAIANLSTMHSPSLLLGRHVIAEPCACNRMCSLCVLGLFLGFHKGCAVPPGSFDFVHECKRWWKPTENSKGRNNGVRGVHAHMRILKKKQNQERPRAILQGTSGRETIWREAQERPGRDSGKSKR